MARRARHSSGLSFYEEERTVNLDMVREVVLWIVYTVIAVFLGIIAASYFGYRISVTGSSMEPQLVNGQNAMLNRLSYRFSTPKRGDVIAFYPGGNQNSHPNVKRVAGIPGDTVQVVKGIVMINGIPEENLDQYAIILDAGSADHAITLEENEYFVLGDNRNNSEDSRSASIGTVSEEDLIGKVWLSLPIGENGIHLVK